MDESSHDNVIEYDSLKDLVTDIINIPQKGPREVSRLDETSQPSLDHPCVENQAKGLRELICNPAGAKPETATRAGSILIEDDSADGKSEASIPRTEEEKMTVDPDLYKYLFTKQPKVKLQRLSEFNPDDMDTESKGDSINSDIASDILLKCEQDTKLDLTSFKFEETSSVGGDSSVDQKSEAAADIHGKATNDPNTCSSCGETYDPLGPSTHVCQRKEKSLRRRCIVCNIISGSQKRCDTCAAREISEVNDCLAEVYSTYTTSEKIIISAFAGVIKPVTVNMGYRADKSEKSDKSPKTSESKKDYDNKGKTIRQLLGLDYEPKRIKNKRLTPKYALKPVHKPAETEIAEIPPEERWSTISDKRWTQSMISDWNWNITQKMKAAKDGNSWDAKTVREWNVLKSKKIPMPDFPRKSLGQSDTGTPGVNRNLESTIGPLLDDLNRHSSNTFIDSPSIGSVSEAGREEYAFPGIPSSSSHRDSGSLSIPTGTELPHTRINPGNIITIQPQEYAPEPMMSNAIIDPAKVINILPDPTPSPPKKSAVPSFTPIHIQSKSKPVAVLQARPHSVPSSRVSAASSGADFTKKKKPSTQQPVVIGPALCTICKKKYPTLRDRDTHFRSVHGEAKMPLHCKLCKRGYFEIPVLLKHIQLKHPDCKAPKSAISRLEASAR